MSRNWSVTIFWPDEIKKELGGYFFSENLFVNKWLRMAGVCKSIPESDNEDVNDYQFSQKDSQKKNNHLIPF